MSLNNSDGLQPNSDHVSGIFEDSMNCFKDASIEWRWKLLLDWRQKAEADSPMIYIVGQQARLLEALRSAERGRLQLNVIHLNSAMGALQKQQRRIVIPTTWPSRMAFYRSHEDEMYPWFCCQPEPPRVFWAKWSRTQLVVHSIQRFLRACFFSRPQNFASSTTGTPTGRSDGLLIMTPKACVGWKSDLFHIILPVL